MPLLLQLAARGLARRVLRLEPRLGRPAAKGRIYSLRHNAFQSHAAGMVEYGRAVVRQVFDEVDGVLIMAGG